LIEAARITARNRLSRSAVQDCTVDLWLGLSPRVMIAMMRAGDPEVLKADEPTTALDVTVQVQIAELLTSPRDAWGMPLVLVTHDLGVVAVTCERAVVMYRGKAIEAGSVADFFATPHHPYTKGLMRSSPRVDQANAVLHPVPGVMPQPNALDTGCDFAPRCMRGTARAYSRRA
jgi:oligopeptide/dipeptide ABC transporter ATP-binding protein